MAGENSKIYTSQGGADRVYENGSTQTVKSGATHTYDSGSALNLNGTTTFGQQPVLPNVANVTAGIPKVFRVTIAASTGDTDVVPGFKCRVIDFWVVKTALGGATDAVTLKNGATAITNALDLNVADKTVVRAGTIDDAQHDVLAAGTLKISAVSSTSSACEAYITVLPVA